MKRIFAIFLFPLLLISCIGTAKFNRIVFQKFSGLPKINEQNTNNFILIQTDKLDNLDDLLVKSEKLKSFFIPAILYWGWNNTIKCELNPLSVASRFNSSLVSYANSIDLQRTLNGQRLEISIESIPNSFIYFLKGGLLLIRNFGVLSNYEDIVPEKQELRFSYKLITRTNEIKTGTITIDCNDQPVINTWGPTRKFIGEYINIYNGDLTSLSKDAVDNILTDITSEKASE